jgi:type I restriction enzyme M protein
MEIKKLDLYSSLWGYLKGIISLPASLFYGTGIPAFILVLDKENAVARRGIFMIDASDGFTCS